MQNQAGNENPPIFNLPRIIVLSIAVLAAAHVIRVILLPGEYAEDFILLFAVIPARYGDLGALVPYPIAALYTPVTHAFVHADWTHLLINLAWMMAFGTPVARRFGALRFILLSIAGIFAGFVFHLFTHANEFVPMLGASGGVSALMGAAIRLPRNPNKPVLSLGESLKNRGFLAFILIWLAINFLIGMVPGMVAGENAEIAWQAHVGGFLTGLFLFDFFNPRGNANS